MANKEKKISPKICGAKAKSSGKPCRNYALENGRCKFHGGKSTGPALGSANNMKHGLYFKGLKQTEQEIWDDIAVTDLDHEIKMAKIQLKRVSEAYAGLLDDSGEFKFVANDAGKLELTKMTTVPVTDEKGNETGTYTTIEKTLPDYRMMIDRCLNTIGRLVKARFEMTGDGSDDPDELARKIKASLDAMEKTIVVNVHAN